MIPGETVASGAPLPYEGAELTVLQSAAGYFVGYEDADGSPWSRESRYYRSYELADEALINHSFGRHTTRPKATRGSLRAAPVGAAARLSDKTPLQLKTLRMGFEEMEADEGRWTAHQLNYLIEFHDEGWTWKDIAIAIDRVARSAKAQNQLGLLVRNAINTYKRTGKLAAFDLSFACTHTEWLAAAEEAAA